MQNIDKLFADQMLFKMKAVYLFINLTAHN